MEERSHPARTSATKQEVTDQFVVFSSLWAMSALLWSLPRCCTGWEATPVLTALSVGSGLAAFSLLVRPTSTIPLLALTGLVIAYGSVALPFVTATELLWTFSALAIAVSAVTTKLFDHRATIHTIGLFGRFAPCLRVLLVITLFSLSLTRWNWGFLDAQSSTVRRLLETMATDQVPVPDWLCYMTMSTLLIVDGVVALALLIPRQRRLAVSIGACYFPLQAVLGLGVMRDMLPLVLTLLYLFTCGRTAGSVMATLRRAIPLAALRSAGLPTLAGLFVTSVLAVQTPSISLPRLPNSDILIGGGTLTFCVLAIALMFVTVARTNSRTLWLPLASRNLAHLGLIGMLLVTVAYPFVGLGTWGLFSCQSDLVTEGGRSNHLFIPQLYLRDFQTDLVRVDFRTGTFAGTFAGTFPLTRDQVVPRFEVLRYLHQNPDAQLDVMAIEPDENTPVSGRLDGTRMVAGTPFNWLSRKLLAFQSLDADKVPKRAVPLAGR